MSVRSILTAVGYVVGSYFGYPELGAVVGGLVGGALEPDAKQTGPRLNDLKGPSASYGTPIPYIEGSWRTAGCFIYASDKREIAHETSDGGKGGPGVDSTTFTYEMDVLILLSINILIGVRRIWSNGRLVWSAADDADAQTLSASAQTDAWRELRFYDGNDSQMPDPVYEAAVGVGNAPAYRGRATLFIEGLNLGGSGQLPILTFEVVSQGTVATTFQVEPVYEVGGFDVSDGWIGDSGVGNYVGGLGHAWYAGYFGPSATDKLFSSVLYDPLLPPPNVTQIFSDVPNIGTTVNFATGVSDENFYMLVGQSGFTITVIDNMGGFYPANYPTDPNGRWIAMATYARFGGVTLGLLASPFQGLELLGSPPVHASTAYLPRNATKYGGEWIVMPITQNGLLYKYNLTTLAANGTMPDVRPNDGSNSGGALLTDEITGKLYYAFGDSVHRWNGTGWDLYMSGLPAEALGMDLAGTVSTGLTMTGGDLYSLHRFGSGPFSYRLSVARTAITVAADLIPLDEVVSRLCLRTGLLTAADIDVTDLVGDFVRGVAFSQVAPTRQAIELLMSAYLFEAVEGEKIRFVKRGAAPALTIPYRDLGASTGDGVEPLPLSRLNDRELPRRVTIKYANALNDFQDGAESGDRLVTQSTAVNMVELTILFTPTEAKRVADANTMDLAVNLNAIGPVSVTRKYSRLECTDVVILTAKDGSTFRSRIQKLTQAAGLLTYELVLDDATVIDSVAATGGDYFSSSLLRAVAATAQLAMDIPILRDADNDGGFYDMVKPNGTKWAGAVIYSSADDATDLKRETSVTDRAVFGIAQSALGDWTGPRVIDEMSRVTVNIGLGVLTSSTRDAVLNDASINLFALGLPGRIEVGQFIQADFVSTGIYTLSRFLRGSRGTEWAMTGHVTAESFALLRVSGTRRIAVSTTLLGLQRFYRAVSIGKSADSVAGLAFTDNGVGLKPFSPFDVRALRNGATGEITLEWQRRTRLATRAIGPLGISEPLGELTEAYSVDVFTDNTYATVVRTLNSTVAFVGYSVAQQVADFGSVQSTIYIKVYQLSAAVGRGYPLQAAV